MPENRKPDEAPDAPHLSGSVTLIGRPNVGKSTLLNRMLGEKVAITSPRPQTTRNRIPGVLTRPDAQIVFIDTPGIHLAHSALNKYMVEIAHGAIFDTDAVALLIEAAAGPEGQVAIGNADTAILETLSRVSKPVFLVINKIDRIAPPILLPLIDMWRRRLEFADIVPISALKGDGVDRLVELFVATLPQGPSLYPEDALTDLPERFIGAEIIREKLFRQLKDEVPYSTAVTIETWRERARDDIVEIAAIIHVERESQKAIVIGKGGQRIKALGINAREDLQRMLGTRVHLELFVRVDPRWTRSQQSIRRLGYR